MENNTELKKIQSKNCKKYLLLSIILNPLLIMFLGFFLWSMAGGSLGPIEELFPQLATTITSFLIIITIIIPINIIKLKKKALIGKKCFIVIFIIWLIPFLLALLASGSCTIGSFFDF